MSIENTLGRFKAKDDSISNLSRENDASSRA